MNPIDRYILAQDEVFQPHLHQLRNIINSLAPQIEERFSYNCPFFYYKKKPFVYIGKNNTYKGKVVIGFCDGTSLSNSQGILVGEGKIVRHIVYDPIKKIEKISLNEVLQEGLLIIDEKLKK